MSCTRLKPLTADAEEKMEELTGVLKANIKAISSTSDFDVSCIQSRLKTRQIEIL
jgi:hypothetical protein